MKTVQELKREILEQLTAGREVAPALENALALAGRFFGAARAYLLELPENGGELSVRCEWDVRGIASLADALRAGRLPKDAGDFLSDFEEDGCCFCQSAENCAGKHGVLPDTAGLFRYVVRLRGEPAVLIGFDFCRASSAASLAATETREALHGLSDFLAMAYLLRRDGEWRQAEVQQELRHANEQFDDLLANVNCGIAIYHLTAEGKLRLDFVNEGLSALTGSSKEELLSAFQDGGMFTVDPQYRTDLDRAFRKAVRDAAAGSATYQVTAKSGKKAWITAKISSFRKKDGTRYIYVNFVDVTSEMENTRELQRKYEFEKRRSWEDSSTVAYAVFNLSTGQTIEMERRQPLIPLAAPMKMEDFCGDILARIHSEKQRKTFASIFSAAALLQKHEEGVEEQTVEFQRTMPNGKVIWVRSRFHVMKEAGGSDLLLTYSCNDINLSKSLEIMTSSIANEDYDMIGCINFYDDSAILMYGKNSSYNRLVGGGLHQEERYSQALDWFVTHAVVPEERETYRLNASGQKIKEALSQSGSYEFLLHVNGENGSRLTKKIKYTMYDKDSDVCFFTQIDLTRLTAEEERRQQTLQSALLSAKQANEAKTAFLSRMSHDMRTPMNGILGLAALSADETDASVLRENMRKIKESGDYLLSLINDTLDFQRIESGKMVLDRHVVCAQTVLDGILDIVRPAMERKKINFRVINENADLSWFVRLDEVRFKQILINLMSNAVKFTPEGGIVTFTFGCAERLGSISHDYIRISDTGIGMSDEFIRTRLFKPFSQESNQVSSQYAGSGLGLSIVHSLVELMGGRIEVESELGSGTTFTIYMDFERVSEVTAQKIQEAGKRHLAGDAHSLEGRHVLLAEDHPLNAEIAKRLLAKVGCRVTLACNGQECVRLFASAPAHHFDVILMDVRMPVMDGLEATRQIRQLPVAGAATIPIIAMTANAYAEDVRNCLAAGMNAHIAKPIDPDTVYETLRQQIGSAAPEGSHL